MELPGQQNPDVTAQKRNSETHHQTDKEQGVGMEIKWRRQATTTTYAERHVGYFVRPVTLWAKSQLKTATVQWLSCMRQTNPWRCLSHSSSESTGERLPAEKGIARRTHWPAQPLPKVRGASSQQLKISMVSHCHDDSRCTSRGMHASDIELRNKRIGRSG